MTERVSSLTAWQKLRQTMRGSVGFVPTMGALHQGHSSLIERSKRENDLTVVSIFVNPTQFNNAEDFEKYPIQFDQDFKCLQAEGVNYVIYPKREEIYADGYTYQVTETSVSRTMEGLHRPGHFDGVLTVVLKLLNLVQPHHAYFGEKDYQQLLLIQKMCQALFIPTEIVPCPTVRETSGLALSSRNVRLSSEEKALAPRFYYHLIRSPSAEAAYQALVQDGFRVDYIEEFEGRRFGAVFLGPVRLIDNVPLSEVQA